MVSTTSDGRHKLDGYANITWPSSAFIVLDLLSRPYSTATLSSLVEKALELRLINHITNAEYTQASLADQVQFCMAKGYITPVELSSDVLTVTDKVDAQLKYLQLILAESAIKRDGLI